MQTTFSRYCYTFKQSIGRNPMPVSIRSLALASLFIATGAISASFYITNHKGKQETPALLAPLLISPAQASTPNAGNTMPTLAPMLSKVTPSVVNIYTKQRVRVNNRVAEFFGGGVIPQEHISQSLGSGVIVDAARGLILTNNHVVEGADEVSVGLSDGRTFEAQPVGSDPDTDIAVIRIAAKDLLALPIADSTRLRVGDYVVAVGNPFGLGQTVTSGIVSAVGRSGLQGMGYQNFIQTDASINPGNSGGALVNLNGELVGINAASFNPHGSAAGNIGLGFAIPSNLAKEIMRQLMAYGEVRRGSLGLEAQTAQAQSEPFSKGAWVTRVYRGSPAEAAGIRISDVIISANGQRIESADALSNLEGLLPLGTPVHLDIVRDKQHITVSAQLRAQPKEQEAGQLDARLAGAILIDLPERYKQSGMRGVIINKVIANSRAANNGLEVGDRILLLNEQNISDLNELRALLTQHAERLELGLARGRQSGYLQMR
jgi:serine protease DegQ